MQDEHGHLIQRNYPLLQITVPYAPQNLRPKLLALYGLLATVEESLYRASDPVVSTAKLSWWYEELMQAKCGTGNHPLSLQLQSSGALAAWPENLIERLFTLAVARVEAEGINNEKDLQQLCESLGGVHLELESLLNGLSVPAHDGITRLAISNGLIQLFRESFKASRPSFYWVPLSDCARFGVERLQIVEKAFSTEFCQVFEEIAGRTSSQNEKLQNLDWLTELPQSWAGTSQHSLLYSLLQQRQLSLLQRRLAERQDSSEIRNSLHHLRLGDGWFAWRAVRRLNSVGKPGKAVRSAQHD